LLTIFPMPLVCTSFSIPIIWRFHLLMESQSSCISYQYFFSFLFIYSHLIFLLHVLFLQTLKLSVNIRWGTFWKEVFLATADFWWICVPMRTTTSFSPLSLFLVLHMSNNMLALSACIQNGHKTANMQVPRDDGMAVGQSLGQA
jgi:hypothetical protein